MHIEFTIPEWLLWLIGVPSGIVILFFTYIGFAFFRAFKDGRWG
ncbi:hypothetical protein [Bacillus toyonensis]|nr:hypothetical protein [Bacillus toyonensis]